MPDNLKMDRNLALEAVRVTEMAALSASRLMGRGDEKAADQAAVDAMRSGSGQRIMDDFQAVIRTMVAEEQRLLVLRDVMFGNRRHFNELLAGSEEGIASNILADRLKRLVAAGLLTREDTRPGQRTAYSLTEAAIQLVPVLAELGTWGTRHLGHPAATTANTEILRFALNDKAEGVLRLI